MSSFSFDAAVLNEFNDACRGASNETTLIFLAETADVDGVKAVDVLLRSDAVEGPGLVNVGWEGCLYKDSMDLRVGVEGIDLFEEGIA